MKLDRQIDDEAKRNRMLPQQRPLRYVEDNADDPRTNLSELSPGDSGLVRQVNARGAIRQRLLDMGMLPDARVRVERVAPAGDPIWIRLRGFQLSLRKNEARAVVVTQQ